MTEMALLSSMAPIAGHPFPSTILDDDITAMEARSNGVNSHSVANSGSWNPVDKSWLPSLPEKPNLNPFDKLPTTAPPPTVTKGLSGEASLIYWWFGILLAVYVLSLVVCVLLSVELFKMFNTSHILAKRANYLSSRRNIRHNDLGPSPAPSGFKDISIHSSPSKPG